MKEIHSCSSRSNAPKRNHHFCDLHSNEFNRQLCACGSIGAAHTRTHSRINGLIAFHQLKLWIYECDNRIVCHQHHTHFDSFWMRVNPLKTGTIPAKTFILISYFLLWPLSWLHWAKSVKNCCSFLHSLMRSILVAHSNVTDALFHGGKCVWDIFIGHTMLIGLIWFGVNFIENDCSHTQLHSFSAEPWQANSTAPKMAFNIDRHHKGRIEQISVMLIGHLKWRRWKCNNHQNFMDWNVSSPKRSRQISNEKRF